MDNRHLETALQHLRKLVGVPAGTVLNDGQLLERFASHRDEAAFELLVRRHGAMVGNVCRRILGNSADADDAFQATFLVLVRKASSLDCKGPLAPWLYTVAQRVALRARAKRGRGQAGTGPEPTTTGSDPAAADLREVIDQELSRLPEKYRAPVVLCYLEGKTHEEAAQELHWPLGTLKCRVLRARDQLRARLARRGLALSAAFVASALTTEAARASVSAALVESAVKTAFLYAAGSAAAATIPAVALAEGALRAMFLTKLKVAAAVALVLVSVGSGAMAYHARGGGAATTSPGGEQFVAAADPAKPAVRNPLDAPWEDMAGADDVKALRAIAFFSKTPKESLAYLKANVKPILIDAKMIAVWIGDLESEQFAVRERARVELEACGEYAVQYLEAALDGKPTLNTRKQIETILKRLKSPERPARWVQTVRALALLEQFGTPEAKEVVLAVSKGRAKAWPTQEAETTLDRMTEKPSVALPRLWDVFPSRDEAKVARAFLAMAGQPKATVTFLKELLDNRVLRQDTPGLKERVNALIDGLDSPQFADRVKANEDLVALGEPAVPLLREALALRKRLPLETRRRIELAIDAIGKQGAGVPRGGKLETGDVKWDVLLARLTVLLEHIGTPEAKELLEQLKNSKALQAKGGKEALSPDGKIRAVIGADGAIALHDVATEKVLASINGHVGGALCVCFSPDGKFLASGGADRRISLWQPATGKQVRTFTGHAASVVGIAFSEDGRSISSEGEDKATIVWDVATGKVVK